MHYFYVLIDQDAEGELVYSMLDHQNLILEVYGASGNFPIWHFHYQENTIKIYGAALEALPVGENREEIEFRVLQALNLT